MLLYYQDLFSLEFQDFRLSSEQILGVLLSTVCPLSCPQLGAGVSLPGVVAARCGAQVILSDRSDEPRCLENCRRSCEANGLQGVRVLALTWGDVSPDLILLPELDVVLGSDVFYDPEGQFLSPSVQLKVTSSFSAAC